MWTVIATLDPEWLDNMLSHALAQRAHAVNEKAPNRTEIAIKQEWISKLLNYKILQRKPHRQFNRPQLQIASAHEVVTSSFSLR